MFSRSGLWVSRCGGRGVVLRMETTGTEEVKVLGRSDVTKDKASNGTGWLG
jgi:hypothetical protein